MTPIIETYNGVDICEGWHAPAGPYLVRSIDSMGFPKHPDSCPHFPTVEKCREFIDILQKAKADHAAKGS
jgi:hypothetical protein